MARHTAGLTESHSSGSLNHLWGHFFLVSFQPIILTCLILSPCLVYLRVLPCVHASLSQDGSSEEGYG